MVAYRYSTVILLLAVVTSTVTSQTTGDYCANEILRVSNAGKITATTSDPLTIGESVSITCSTDCAYYWHTVLVDGEVMSSSNSAITTEDYQLSVKNIILNCPDCTQPEDVNCSGDSQEGPIQSVLNFTLLSSGDHYVQCIAHMYHPDSDLWPDNRIISISSKTIKIKGPAVKRQDHQSSSASTAKPTWSTISIMPTSSVSITPKGASPTLLTTSSRQYSSIDGSTSSKPSHLPSHVTDTSSSLSPSLSTPLSVRVLTSTRIPTSISTEAVKTIQSTTTTMVSLTTNHRSPVDATTLPSPPPTQTLIARADPVNQMSSSCNLLNMGNTTVYVIFGVLVVICVLLIIAVVALIIANRKGVAQYNHLSLSIQGRSSINGYQPDNCGSDEKVPPTSSSPEPSSDTHQSSPV